MAGSQAAILLSGKNPSSILFNNSSKSASEYSGRSSHSSSSGCCSSSTPGGACYPEGHPESQTLEEDLIHLKEKVDAGCEFLTTQMFFDNNILYNFMYKALKHGIDVPVVAGIMPITNANQVKRSIALSGSLVPRRFLAIVDRFGSDPAAMKQAGIAYATDQIIDLIANGVNHVHIYTMNKPDVAGAILEQ